MKDRMSLVSWAKKELSKLKLQTSKRLLLLPNPNPNPNPPHPQTTFFNTSLIHYHLSPHQDQVSELAADLRCTKCQHKVEALISTINDLESIVVHVVDKKVTLTRKPINHSSNS